MMKFALSSFLFVVCFCSLSYSKVEVKLEDDPVLAEQEKNPTCNTGYPNLAAEDDSIEFVNEIIDEATEESTSLNYKPFFKFYADTSLKNVAPVEMNDEGLFINKEKVCEWGGRSCKFASKNLKKCDLYMPQKKEDRSERKFCEPLTKFYSGFKVEEITNKYYSILVDKKNYYISRAETPQYKYVKSRMKIANELKEKLFSKINKNFKKHQNDFLTFVKKEEKCFKKNGRSCSYKVSESGSSFADYLCLDKKIPCSKNLMNWSVAEKLTIPYYKASLPECFNLDKMEIDVTDYKDDGKFKIYNVLNGYDRNVICSFYIVLHDKEPDEIFIGIYSRIDIEGIKTEYEDDYVAGNSNVVEERFKLTKEYENNRRACSKMYGGTATIPSRLHDKSLQKME